MLQRIVDNWEKILLELKEEHDLSDVSFDTWLKPLVPHSMNGSTLFLFVPDQQQTGLNYIIKKYSLPLKVAVSEFLGEECNVDFILNEEEKSESKAETSYINRDPDTLLLNPNYTFETFVVGSNSRFAHSASLAVAESPGEVWNPLYLWGGSGLGKTHLMQSIAHFVKNKSPESTVRYVSSEKFTNELIESIGNNNLRNEFKKKYRNVDILLIDDIQFIMGKERTQEEFFNIFNELHGAGKQVVITSDVPPSKMHVLEDRLKTRLEWGLVVDINVPDYETRMAILKKKQSIEGYEFGDDVLDYIANNIKSNIRELEGALNKLIAFSNLEKTEVTYDIAVRELHNIISPDTPKEITADSIIKCVCDHYGITEASIVSSQKNAGIAYPRQVAMYLCYHLLEGITYNSIGISLGGRDHSTVLHGIKKITTDMEKNEETKNTVNAIIKKITSY